MAIKTLIRKRFIPMETIVLDKDKILFESPELVITSWDTLNPRSDFSRGVSAYFIKEGFKISKFYNAKNEFLYWYCDMIRATIDGDTLLAEDLLLDVIIDKDGSVRVLDAKEAADALREQLITAEMLCDSLTSLDLLLSCIASGEFSRYSDIIQAHEPAI
ncbi:MAG: DUF402 domain-containing protein [Lachnospiraceae bacterium]|nr:DUF402 domain-containing protein [Lachnospiraceae bacterium]